MRYLLLFLFLFLFPTKSLSDDFENFTYIDCDKVAKRLQIENRTVRGHANYIDLAEKHPKYYQQYHSRKSGECNISDRKIIWTANGETLFIYVDEKPWVHYLNMNIIRMIWMNPYDEEGKLELHIITKEGGGHIASPKIPIRTPYIRKNPGTIHYSE